VKRASLSGKNFGALMVLYSKIGRHVLTPFFDVSQSKLIGRQEDTLLS